MPIVSISYQNGSESINAAYRPIIFRCKAHDPIPNAEHYKPVMVFCDIYVEGLYYKSLWKSSPINDDGIAPEYEFDIQDALQELLTYNLPQLYSRNVLGMNNTIKTVFVRFRNYYLNDGFVESEQPEPIQGTATTPPVPGGGTQSNSIYVLNANIHHEEPQNLSGLLFTYRYGDFATGVLPLTKRPKKYKLCKNDSSFFPIISGQRPTKICIRIHNDDGEIEEICSDYLVDCPTLKNLTYTNVRDGLNQKFVFNWTLPDNWEVTAGLTIYYRKNGNSEWSEIEIGIDPTHTMNLPIGKYDFKFQLFGSCKNNLLISALPGFTNIGISSSQNQPPTASIYWDDSHTTEVRECELTNSCLQILSVNSVSDPEGVLDYFVWQRSSNNGATWTNTSNLNQSTISFQTQTEGNYIFRVKAVDIEGLEGYSNQLKFNVSKDETGSATITNVIGLPNTCHDAGEILNFTIEGDNNQNVKFQLEILDANPNGHGALMRVFDNTTMVFNTSLPITPGFKEDGTINLGTNGVKTFRGEMCLRPCIRVYGVSSMAVKLTLYDNDGITLSNQSIFFQASMSCEL